MNGVRISLVILLAPVLFACSTTTGEMSNVLAHPYPSWTPTVNEHYCAITRDRLQRAQVGKYSVGESLSFGVRHPNSESSALAPVPVKSGEMHFWIQLLPSIFLEDIVDISGLVILSRGREYTPTRVHRQDSDQIPLFALTGTVVETMWSDIVAGGEIEYRYMLNPEIPISATVDGGEMIHAAAAMFAACVNAQSGSR